MFSIEQSPEKKIKYFNDLKKQAENNNAETQYTLAILYEYGYGTEKNLDEAIKWYEKATEAGSNGAKGALALLEEKGLYPSNKILKYKNMLTKAQKLYNIGIHYFVLDNEEKHVEYLEIASALGNIESQYSLGMYYRLHSDIPHHQIRALTWYIKAAQNGHKEAIDVLKNNYGFTEEAPKDPNKLILWIEKNIKEHENKREYILSFALIYYEGILVPQNYKRAFELFEKEAKKENFIAQYFLGICYEEGKGVEKNINKAIEYYALAANKYPWAKIELDRLLKNNQ